MQKINELELAKELIRFPSITPIDAGAPASIGVIDGNLISSLANSSSFIFCIFILLKDRLPKF